MKKPQPTPDQIDHLDVLEILERWRTDIAAKRPIKNSTNDLIDQLHTLFDGWSLPDDVVMALRFPLTTSETSAALSAIDGGIVLASGEDAIAFIGRDIGDL